MLPHAYTPLSRTGVKVQMTEVRLLPPKEGCRMRVSLESRKGMRSLFPEESSSMHLRVPVSGAGPTNKQPAEHQQRLVDVRALGEGVACRARTHMSASTARPLAPCLPEVLACTVLSEPARSTTSRMDTRTTLESCRAHRLSSSSLNVH